MRESYIGRDSKVHLTIIDNHLLELHHTAKNEERHSILSILRQLIQEKNSQGDDVAVGVLDWAIDRILRS